MLCKVYNYQNFNFSSVPEDTLKIIVLGIFIGIIAGTVWTVAYKTITHSFIRAFVKNELYTPEKAKSINDLDFIGKWYIKNELKHSYKTMRRYVLCSNEDEVTEKTGKQKDPAFKKIQVENGLFYLPEEKRIEAELRFSEIRHPIGSIVITSALAGAAAYFAMFAAPELLQMLDNFITMLG